jgi:lipid-binding SYLF domain-containing protein
MKLTTTVIAFTGLLAAAPAFTGLLAAAPAFAATEAESAQQIVTDAVQTVQQIKADPHFADDLKNATGVFIMPDLVKGAFIVGGEGAQGVLLKHKPDGTWSDPAFVNIGSISVGAQAGGKAGPAAMILMTQKALNDFTQANNFSLNGKAGLTIVNDSAQGQAPVSKGPVSKGDVIVWSNQGGVFAGVTVGGADIMQNTTKDRAYYGKTVDAQQILNGGATNASAKPLTSALPG